MKKALSAILSIILILSMLMPMVAFAEEPTEEPAEEVSEEVTEDIIISELTKENNDTKRIFLEVGKSKRLKVSINPQEATNQSLRWRSSDESIISVTPEGRITALNTGFATIRVKTTDGSSLKLRYKVFGIKRNEGNTLSTDDMTIVSTKKAKYTYEQLEKDLQALSEAYPDMMSYSSVGKTYDNRNIYEAVVGNPKATRVIFIQACMHAREYLNALLVMRQIESLCANYYTGSYRGKAYCELLQNTCIHFIPMLNPDGVSISQFGAEGIRDKKLRKKLEKMCEKYGNGKRYYYTRWKANARGVDLNKNYPVNWKKNKTGLGKPRSEGYKGSEAASEKETKILMSRVKELRPKAVISYHSTGSIMYWNFLQKGEFRAKCKSLFDVAHSLTGYKDAEPGITGDSSDLTPNFGSWVCDRRKIPTLTIETGVDQCPLKIDEFEKIWKKHRFMPVALSYWALCNNDTYIKTLTPRSKGFRVSWKLQSEKITGYQIKYSTRSKFSSNTEYITLDNVEQYAKAVSGLKANKKYYVSVRTYRVVDGIRFYGKWSKVYSVVTEE